MVSSTLPSCGESTVLVGDVFQTIRTCEEQTPFLSVLSQYRNKTGMQNSIMSMGLTNSSFFPKEAGKEFEHLTLCLKNDKVAILHSLITPEILRTVDSHGKSVLLYAAYEDSQSCLVYLLQRGMEWSKGDKDGKTLVHICAYRGNIEGLRTFRSYYKLRKIMEVNVQMTEIMSKFGFKKREIKEGVLRSGVSSEKLHSFDKMRQALTDLYNRYFRETTRETIEQFSQRDKSKNRNAFHYAALNQFTKCAQTIEYMFQEINNCQFSSDNLHYLAEISDLLKEPIDFRLYDSTLVDLQDLILPEQIQTTQRDICKMRADGVSAILKVKDSKGATPLEIASKQGSTLIITALLKHSSSKELMPSLIRVANSNLARSHLMDLCQASKLEDIKSMDFLISCGENINKKKSISGTFALLEAIKAYTDSVEPMQLLLKSGADANQQDTNGWTIFHHACHDGRLPVIMELFNFYEKGLILKIEINKLTNKGYHSLHLAAGNNHCDVIDYLLNSATAKKLGLNDCPKDGNRWTMLHHAAKKGSLEALKTILKLLPATLLEMDSLRNTALHLAASHRQTQCVKYLLYYDSDDNKLKGMTNSQGKLARDLSKDHQGFDDIFTLIRKGDVNRTRQMLHQSPDVLEIKTPHLKRTLLILAVIEQHLLLVKLLSEFACYPQHKDAKGKRAIDYALQLQNGAKTKEEKTTLRKIEILISEAKPIKK